jgi:hypothetical protein
VAIAGAAIVVAGVAAAAWWWAPANSTAGETDAAAASDTVGEAAGDVLTPLAGIVAAGLVLIGGLVVLLDAARSRRSPTPPAPAVAAHHRALEPAPEPVIDVAAVDRRAARRRSPRSVPDAEPLTDSWPESWSRGSVTPIATASDLLFRTRLAAGLQDELFTHREAPVSGS